MSFCSMAVAVSHPPNVPDGMCQCGCGAATATVRRKDSNKGLVRGQRRLYLKGHYHRAHYPNMVRKDEESGCWIWLGHTDKAGYGRCGGRLAFHEFYRQAKGSCPKGYHIDHLCRVRLCVNPDHLEAVTPATNTRRSPRTRLTLEIAQTIKQRGLAGETRAALGREYNVSPSHIANIVTGKKWVDRHAVDVS